MTRFNSMTYMVTSCVFISLACYRQNGVLLHDVIVKLENPDAMSSPLRSDGDENEAVSDFSFESMSSFKTISVCIGDVKGI